MMEPAKHANQAHHSIAKHTAWDYPTTIHLERVSQIKDALSLELPDLTNTHHSGAFTAFLSFPTTARMVHQVA